MDDQPMNNHVVEKTQPQKTVPVTLYFCEKTTMRTYTVLLSGEDAQKIASQFEELKKSIASQPMSEKTKTLQQDFINILCETGAISNELSEDELVSLLESPMTPFSHQSPIYFPFQNRASEWLCTYVSFGSGASFPIIILPRFIPFILTPIPRVFLRWNAKEGVTSCGGLASGTGFIAVGEQKGFALGFWGIGFTFSLPPLMNTYGMAGYALYATVTADYIEYYPPNSPPEITGADPMDREENISLSLSELRFRIDDADGDLMNYAVTTEPDIGSGSGSLKSDGVYTIPVSDLQSYTDYTWHIQVDDGKDTMEQTLWFKTEPIAPVITNPLPMDGQRDVPVDLASLRFTLKDFQGDAMDYTVETSPDIGSGRGTDVHDGTYTIPVGGLALGMVYRWFINVTDGQHWTRKMFNFETGYPAQFDPFDYGWQYRKQIMIDHTKVAGDLLNFPVLVCTVDNDLSQKAQEDGDDILFMNGAGVATKLNHEIEFFDGGSGGLVAWVNIPVLSSLNDTVLYLYYGNERCLSKENVEGTWDAHYVMVQHLQADSCKNMDDSTSNHNDVTAQGGSPSYQQPGKVGRAVRFDDNDYLSFENAVRGAFPLSLEVWFNTDTVSDTTYVISNGAGSRAGSGLAIYTYTGQLRLAFRNKANSYSTQCIYPNAMVGSWYYYAGAWSGQMQEDGHFVLNSEIFSETPKSDTVGDPWALDIGAAGDVPGHIDSFNGLIDEVRISDTVRSVEWLITGYQNQNNPTEFLIIGPEEPGP
jgi:hypothetical protein